jgi:predicted RNA binding protein YcfA (HicA-like mRNA interferase family)
MRPLNARQIAKILKDNGFILSRQRGSHMIWKNPATGIIVPVPLHNGTKPIPIGTFLAIVKQSKLPKNKFQ